MSSAVFFVVLSSCVNIQDKKKNNNKTIYIKEKVVFKSRTLISSLVINAWITNNLQYIPVARIFS